MMTKTIRKAISVICAVALLMSLCVVSMVENTSAVDVPAILPIGETVTLTFDNEKGIAGARGNSISTNSIQFVDDPWNDDNTDKALQVTASKGVPNQHFIVGNSNNAEYFATPSSQYQFTNGKTYRLTFKWMAKAGYRYKAADDVNKKHPIKLSYVTMSGTTTTSAAQNTSAINAKSGRSYVAFSVGEGSDVNAAGTLNTTTGFYELDEDTQWMTEEFTFTWDSTKGNSLGIWVCASSFNTDGSADRVLLFDDVSVCEIENGMLNLESYDMDFINSASGAPWNPGHTALLSLSSDYKDANWRSYIDNDGLIHVSAYKTAKLRANLYGYDNHIMMYDPDLGKTSTGGNAYVTLNANKTYAVSFDYKVTASKVGGGQVGIGHFATLGEYNPDTIAIDDFVACTNTDISVASGEWHKFSTSFTVTDSMANHYLDIVLSSGQQGVKTDNSNVVDNYTHFLIDNVNIKEIPTSEFVGVEFETNGGKSKTGIYTKVGSPVNITNAEHSNPDMVFAGWYTDPGFNNVVTSSWTPSAGLNTLYAKWSTSVVYITYNNAGTVSSPERIAPGTPLVRPTRPNGQVFFEGWYTDTTFTNKVTVAPDEDCTLYAKYNNLFIPFEQGGYSDDIIPGGIITEPGSANGNKVVELESFYYADAAQTQKTPNAVNIEVGAYDEVQSKLTPFVLKPSTEYKISFKVKVPAGTNGGELAVYFGGQSKSTNNASKKETGISATWSAAQGQEGIDWFTVSGVMKTNETLYYERVNFTYMNHVYILLSSFDADGSRNKCITNVYIDDLFIAEVTDKIPEGAVAVYYETNGEKIEPSYGYAGEALTLPENPTNSNSVFVGWYTDKSLTVPFTSTVYPNSTTTVYAKWEVVPFVINFDAFANRATSYRFNLTQIDGNNVMRYNYDQGVPYAPNGTPSGLAAMTLNRGTGNEYTVVNGAKYIIKFKYKIEIEDFEVGGMIKPVVHNKYDVWGNRREQDASIKYEKATDGRWENGEIEFIANTLNEEGAYLSLAITGDCTMYLDDIEIIAPYATANIYGSTMLYLNSNGAPAMSPVSGDPGDKIILPNPPERPGFIFKGWFADSYCTRKFNKTVYGEEPITAYAGWIIGNHTESFEELPLFVKSQGFADSYKVYDKKAEGYDKLNVLSGDTSIFRNGTGNGTSAFTICRDKSYELGKGQQYTLSFYVKPTNVTDANGVINLIGIASITDIASPESSALITNVGTLKVGEWQKVSYTFTADSKYIGIATSAGNDMYFDDFTINLNGYVGSPTGDSSVSPFIILAMVILAAGAILFANKKVFAK